MNIILYVTVLFGSAEEPVHGVEYRRIDKFSVAEDIVFTIICRLPRVLECSIFANFIQMDEVEWYLPV